MLILKDQSTVGNCAWYVATATKLRWQCEEHSKAFHSSHIDCQFAIAAAAKNIDTQTFARIYIAHNLPIINQVNLLNLLNKIQNRRP